MREVGWGKVGNHAGLAVARGGKSKNRVADSRFGIDGNRFDPR